MKSTALRGLLNMACLLLFFNQTGFAATGQLFKVTSTGVIPVSITLCLNINGEKPLSCQNYSTQAGALTINTTIPNHTYHAAGIRVNTPG